MTIFGVDVSEHQDGLSLVRAKEEGMEFAILRLCDGTYVDRIFRSHLADAEEAGMLVSTYWYLRAPSEGTSIAQQVDVIDAQLDGRKDLGVWIDVESVGPAPYHAKLLTAADVWEAKRELERRGYRVPGIYSGRWYWELMPGGEPSMTGLGYLWCSHYGADLDGTPADIYAADGGDQHGGWFYPLGDRTPDILQFSSKANVAGFSAVDANAFKGTLDELAEMFYGKERQSPAIKQVAHRRPWGRTSSKAPGWAGRMQRWARGTWIAAGVALGLAALTWLLGTLVQLGVSLGTQD